jgi:hypothetical protein
MSAVDKCFSINVLRAMPVAPVFSVIKKNVKKPIFSPPHHDTVQRIITVPPGNHTANHYPPPAIK